MRADRDYQPLSYDLRLPDSAQADALRLLDASRAVVNTALVQLWPYLDDFMAERAGPAWKHVVELVGSPDPHGDRQWRCEAETAGRIMRAQAERKQVFQLIQPILSDGFIRPKTEKRLAGKNRKTIKEAIEALQKTLVDDDTAFITMQNVVEQACNHFLEHGEFPTTYEQMQSVPLLSVGLLTYAGDDGGAKGQAYRFALDRDKGRASLLFRFPDEAHIAQALERSFVHCDQWPAHGDQRRKRSQSPQNLAHALGLHDHAGDADHVEASKAVEVNRLDVLINDDDFVLRWDECRHRHQGSVSHRVFELATQAVEGHGEVGSPIGGPTSRVDQTDCQTPGHHCFANKEATGARCLSSMQESEDYMTGSTLRPPSCAGGFTSFPQGRR